MLSTIWNFAKSAFGTIVKVIAKPFMWLGNKLGLCGAGAALATATVATDVAAETAIETVAEVTTETVLETAIEEGSEELISEFICGLFGC